MAQLEKNLPSLQETWVRSLGWEDPLEKGEAPHSSIQAWRAPGLYSTRGHKESNMTEKLISFNLWACLVAQTVKRLPAMRETRIPSLGQEDTLEKEMAIHSSTLAWKIPRMEEPAGLQSTGSQSRRRLSNFTTTLLTKHFGK